MSKQQSISHTICIAVALMPCVSSCMSPSNNAVPMASIQQHILTDTYIHVANMGHYCSLLDWDLAGWDFRWEGVDPCGTTQGIITRAGIYDPNGTNHIAAVCGSQVDYYNKSNGAAGLQEVKNLYSNRSGCIFMVAPAAMPIFDSPFIYIPQLNLPPGFSAGNGTDLIQPEFPANYYTTNCQGLDYRTKMNDQGEDKTCVVGVDNHLGNDWGMDRGTNLYAVAPGIVRRARAFQTFWCGSDSAMQQEIYIEHNVISGSITDPHFERYLERFATAYYHMDASFVQSGQEITDPTNLVIARSGNTGGSSSPHLHFGVARLTNTARAHVDHLDIYDGPGGNSSNFYDLNIEVYGWNGAGPDPFIIPGIQYGRKSGLSINLWKPGQAPSRGLWD